MKGLRLAVLIVVVYALSHAAAYLARSRATSYVHDLTFSYSAILAALLIGAVGVFLTGITTAAQFIRGSAATPVEAEDVVAPMRRATRELRANVLFALAMVGTQGLVELIRLIDIPFVVWPIHATAFGKTDVLNAIGISAAVLEFIAVFDCVRAMFTLGALTQEARSSPTTSSQARTSDVRRSSGPKSQP
jgi:hypothetical protein